VQNVIALLTNWIGGRTSTVRPPLRPSDTEYLFDNIARLAASNLPRRQILKMGLTGFAAAIISSLSVKQVRADTCDCNGQTYDSDKQCCTPSGIQGKYPITNLGACPDRVPHPGHQADFNGCGPEGSVITNFIPGAFGLATFTGCCNDHDVCYGTCLDAKDGCDSTFLACLNHECNVWYQQIFHGVIYDILYQDCLNVASVYYGAVHFGGTGAYNAAQDGACDCCPPPDPQQPCCPAGNVCGSQCCPPDQSCVNGSCCPNQNVCGDQCCQPGEACVNGSCQATCQYQCPCPSGPNAGKVFATCAECLAVCPSGLACFGYLYCTPMGSNCPTCP
jgi:hypothetical protein